MKGGKYMSEKDTKKLTLKEEKFCREFIKSGNRSDAYKKAGYKYGDNNDASSRAREIYNKPHIRKYIAELLSEYRTDSVADAQEVLEYLTNVMRGKDTEEQVVVLNDPDGGSNAEKVNVKANITQRNRAGELLGKRYGLWTDKIDLDGDVVVILEDDIE